MTAASPALVLLPGLDGTGRLFEWLLKALEGRITARAISYPPDPAMGYAELTDFVCMEIGAAPVFLLGESFSGPVAIEAAARVPDLVKGLVLAGTFVKSPLWPWLIRLASSVNHRWIPEFFIQAALLGAVKDREIAAAVADLVRTLPHKLIRSRLKAVASADASAAFASLSCPILALHGAQDWIVPAAPIKRAIATKPRGEMKLLRGPHMVLQANALDAAREILAFSQAPEDGLRAGSNPWADLAKKWHGGEKALRCPHCGGRINVLGAPWPDGSRQDTYFTCGSCGRRGVATGAETEA